MKRKENYLTKVLFIFYIFALIWIILFKMQFSFKGLVTSRSINLIPFGESMMVNGMIDVKEIIANVLIFIPFGIYISMLKSEWTFIKKVGSGFIISFAVEILQFIFAIGASDITDIIGNTLGGIIGIGIFYAFYKVFREKATKIINVVALIFTVLISAGIGFILIVNM